MMHCDDHVPSPLLGNISYVSTVQVASSLCINGFIYTSVGGRAENVAKQKLRIPRGYHRITKLATKYKSNDRSCELSLRIEIRGGRGDSLVHELLTYTGYLAKTISYKDNLNDVSQYFLLSWSCDFCSSYICIPKFSKE